VLQLCRAYSYVGFYLYFDVSYKNYYKTTEFYVLLTVHLITVLVNNQLDAHFFFLIFVYSISLHVSSNHVLIIRRVNCINTTSGICHFYVGDRVVCRFRWNWFGSAKPVPSKLSSPHPGYQPAASSVRCTATCKHSLVLLRMGEIIARNMSS